MNSGRESMVEALEVGGALMVGSFLGGVSIICTIGIQIKIRKE